MPSRTTAVRILTAAAASLVLTACAADDGQGEQPALGSGITEPVRSPDVAGEVQPAPGLDSGLVAGDFSDIELPTGAEPFNEATVEDGVTVQSFEVTSENPVEVIDHFEETLPERGWNPGQIDQPTDPSVVPEQLQATYTRDDRTLLITAAQIGGDDTQLTLQLSG